MAWDLEEALTHYQTQGAPGDQSALIGLLREIQREQGGGIPAWTLPVIGSAYGIRESYLRAVIQRIPSLRLENTHCLELCGGPNCARRAALAAFVEKTCGAKPEGFILKQTGCMRQCGKGPNIRWDGKLYHRADEALIRRLVDQSLHEETK